MKTVKRSEIFDLVDSAGGTIFTAKFTKKDGSERIMNCRRKVKKGVTGVGMKYDPRSKGLITVYDMQKGAFRMISVKTVQWVKVKGEQYEVVAD